MRRLFFIILSILFLGSGLIIAQTNRFSITNSGWGRLEHGIKVGLAPYESSVAEIDIHRWVTAKGEIVIDEKDNLLTIRLPEKEIIYTLLTDSYVHQDRIGWNYVERQALENDRTFCRVWICTHEQGDHQILVLYNSFVQGYKIVSTGNPIE